MSRRDLIFIAAANQTAANAACEASGLGPETFRVGLVADGSTSRTPEHFYCCTAFGEETQGVLDRAEIPYRRHEDKRGPGLNESRAGGKTPEEARTAEGVQTIEVEEEGGR